MKGLLATTAAAALLTALAAALLEPREDLYAFWGVFFVTGALLGGGLWQARGALSALPRGQQIAWILGVAIVLRVAAFVAPVSLSDDVYRYLWDGWLTLEAGENPYDHRPRELVEAGRGDEALFAAMNSPDTFTVYPPLSMALFAVAWELGDGEVAVAVAWLRAFLVLLELLAVWALLSLLGYLRRPLWWAALYAWHPLVVWEVVAGIHTEAAGLVFLLLALRFALSKRALRAGVMLALAGLAKWTFLFVSPVVAFFLLRRAGGMKGLSLAALATASALAVFLVAYVPFWSEDLLTHHRESLALYSHRFSFNAPVFYGLRWLLGYQEGVTEPVTHLTAPVLTTLTWAGIALAALWQDGSPRRLLLGVSGALASYLVFTPVFHPWYALPLLLVGALYRSVPVATLGMVLVVSYAYYLPGISRAGERWALVLQLVILIAVLVTQRWMGGAKESDTEIFHQKGIDTERGHE